MPPISDEDRWGTLLERRFAPALLTVSLGIGLFSFNQFLVSTALPTAVRDVDGSALMSWAVTAYLVPSIVGGSCAAALKQRLGGRIALLLSGLVFLLGTLVASLAPGMAAILCGRALQGAGDGVVAALCYAMIPALFPPRLIARVFGVEATIWAVSAFGGPLVSGWVTQHVSWRAAFLVNVPIILGFLILAPRVVPRETGPAGPPPDIALFRLSGIALGIMAVAVAAVLSGTPARLACLAVSAVLLVWTVRADRSCRNRLFPATMFRLSTRTGAIYWTILLMPLAQAVSGVYLVLALQRLWGLGAAAAGGIGALMALSWSGFAFLVVSLPKRRGSLARLGPMLNAAGLSGLLLALQTGWIPVVFIAQIVIGAGFGLCWATLSQTVMEGVEPEDRDRAAALLPTVQSAGFAIGAAVAGLVANADGLPQALRAGSRITAPLSWAYGVATLIAAGAVLVPVLSARMRAGGRREAMRS